MPHQCTDCGRTFADGSKEMLSGCPDCGGNKFQFKPDGVDETKAPDETPPEPPEPSVDSSVARTVGNAATAVRDLVSSSDEPEIGATDAPAGDSVSADPDGVSAEPTTATMAETEDAAQASARSDIVSPDDLPPASEPPATRSRPAPVMDDSSESHPAADNSRASDSVGEDSFSNDSPGEDSTMDAESDDGEERTDRPGLSELRDELNDQFESIRVLDPGKYELNLMELYDREEYIIALQEDGKYTIQVPERWEDS